MNEYVYAKWKQTHKYGKQICLYHIGVSKLQHSTSVLYRWVGQIKGMGLTDTNYYIQKTSNKDIHSSTGNTHHLVITYNGV